MLVDTVSEIEVALGEAILQISLCPVSSLPMMQWLPLQGPGP